MSSGSHRDDDGRTLGSAKTQQGTDMRCAIDTRTCSTFARPAHSPHKARAKQRQQDAHWSENDATAVSSWCAWVWVNMSSPSGRVRLHPSGVAKVVRAIEHIEPDMLHISQSIRSPGEVRTHEAISERLRTIRLQPACFSWRAMPPSTLDPIKNQHREVRALFAFTEMPPGFA